MKDNFYYREFPLLTNIEFKVPSQTVTRKQNSQQFKQKIHERNHLAFTIGLTGAQFNVKNYSLDSVRNIAIAKLDSAQQKEWKSNLNANLEFYPFGRDIDRLDPFLSNPFYRLHTRFGVFGGLRISTDPLSAINAGFTFSYSKTVTLTFGWSWLSNQIANEQQVKVLNKIKTVQEAKDYFRRDYQQSNFTIGIAFAPMQIAKSLGIAAEKKNNKKGKE